MPTPNAPWRSPRIRLDEAAPAILRAPDGQQQRGKLEVLSLSGGLLQISNPLQQGSRFKLLFVTDTGPVLGAVEMLPPVSTERQPFRFLDIQKVDKTRLRATVQSHSDCVQDAWIEKYRAAMTPKKAHTRRSFRSLLRSILFLSR